MNFDELDKDILKLNSGKRVVYINKNDMLESIPLSNRSKNALYNANVNSIEKLLRISENRLRTIKNLGSKSITEILTWKYILKQSDGKFQVKEADEFFDITASSKTSYFYKEDKYVKNIKIDELNFSVRTARVLSENGYLYLSDLFNRKEEDFKALGSLGAKSIQEIFDAIENQRYRIVDAKNIESLSNQELFIANISYYVPILHKDLVDICIREEKKNLVKKYKDYCASLYATKVINEAINKRIIEILLEYETESLELDYLQTLLPPDFVKYELLNNSLKELRRKKEIVINDTNVSIKHIDISDYLESLPDNRNSQILKERLSGNTLEDIGKKYGVTRERVRQLCKKLLDRCPILEEDKYIPIFEKYSFSEDEFMTTFETTIQTFVYLSTKGTTKTEDKLEFESILENDSIPRKFRRNATGLIYKDYMKIGNTYILKRRPQVINYVIKSYCKQQTTFEVFLAIYKRIISFAPLEDQNLLAIDSERGYANRIADNKITLWGPHKTFRYYPLEEYDIQNFYKELNLKQYNDTEISTVKFIKDNKQLMKDYDIRDEYELHNFLRKTWDEYGTKGISIDFSRMPHLSIGNASRDKQVMELLFQNAPIKNTELADLYEEEYGVAKSSVLANFFKCIEKYYESGIYVVEEKEFTQEEGDFLKSYLKKDFYRLSTLKDSFVQNVKNADINKLNTFNLKGFGYRIFSSYIIKDKYDSAASFFNYILTKDEIIDESRMDQDLISLGAYKAAVYNMLDQKILYEFDEGKYINIKRLEKLGITKEVLNNLLDEVESVVEKNQFFTMYSLSNIPSRKLINEIAGFENDAFFYDSLLNHTRNRFSSANITGRHIFRKGTDSFQIEDVIKEILKDEKSMDSYNLQKILKGKYNVDITLNRIIKAAAESELYFAGDYIYINYETYLEEF